MRLMNNLYFDVSGAAPMFNDLEFTAWQALGKDAGFNCGRPPGFVNAAHFDFRLKPDSSADKVGFQVFDYTQAGVYGDARWIKEAASISYDFRGSIAWLSDWLSTYHEVGCPSSRKTRFRPAGQALPDGLPPAGFHQKVSRCILHPSSFSKLLGTIPFFGPDRHYRSPRSS